MDAATTMLSLAYLFNWPSQANVSDGAHYKYVVIGTGVGSIVANRLTENSDTTVLLVEAGTYPSDNAILPSTFAAVQGTAEDWNYTSTEELTTKYQSAGVYQLSSGKVLGGGSSTNHLIQLRGAAEDFDGWASYLDDDSWSYSNVLQYFKKSETMKDDEIMASYANFHGTDGPIIVSNQRRDITHGYLESCEEIGLPWMADLNTNVTVGCAESSYIMGDGVRQSTAYGYINNLTRTNLDILLETTAQKIIFEDTVAVGVTLKRADGEIINVYADTEVIVSAGAFGSPKLLLQSGVGPAEDLKALGIEVIADLPVGEELQDHFAVFMTHKMNETTEASEALALTDFPFPIVLISASLDSAQTYGDYLVLGLLMAQDTTYTQAVCSTLFTFEDEICSAINASVTGRNQFISLISTGKGISKGFVKLNSNDPEDSINITQNFYTDSEGTDLANMKKYVKHFLTLYNTTYFKEVNAEIADHGLTDCGDADFDDDTFLECFIKAMTVHLYHPTGTCGMGRVTNSDGEVYGLEHLRVVDVSIMPNITRANTMAAGMMIGEKISDVIKAKYNLVEDIDESSDVETTEEESSSSDSSDSTSDSSDSTIDSSDSTSDNSDSTSDDSDSTSDDSDSTSDSSSINSDSSSSTSIVSKLVDKATDLVDAIVG